MSQFDRDTVFPPIFVKELEYKCSESGDEMLGNWENICSAFWRPKVRQKSPAAYQEAEIKIKNIFRKFLRTNWTYRNFICFTSGSPLMYNVQEKLIPNKHFDLFQFVFVICKDYFFKDRLKWQTFSTSLTYSQTKQR